VVSWFRFSWEMEK